MTKQLVGSCRERDRSLEQANDADLIWFDLFDLQFPQLVEHLRLARMIWGLNKVIIINCPALPCWNGSYLSLQEFQGYIVVFSSLSVVMIF